MESSMVREHALRATNGFLALFIFLALGALSVVRLIHGLIDRAPLQVILWIVLLLVALTGLCGLFIVNPNQARVLTLFGKYMGTVKDAGFWFANPFASKTNISLRV